jgi:predicted nucleotidyltransferase
VTDPRHGARDPGYVLDRFVRVCAEDDRIVAGLLGGSHARGEADAFSDVDLCVIAKDEDLSDVVADRAGLVGRLGDPLFIDDFGLTDIVFFVLADGTEGEIFFGSERRLHELEAGSHRTLFDPSGILDGVTFAEERVDPAHQEAVLREALSWFWHELSHFIAAIGRGHRWWAAGQLEALRAHCVNLVRIEHGAAAGDEPYEKLDRTAPVESLSSLEATFVPPEPSVMVEAAVELVRFHRDLGTRVAEAHGLRYPWELARMTGGRLDDLVESRRWN